MLGCLLLGVHDYAEKIVQNAVIIFQQKRITEQLDIRENVRDMHQQIIIESHVANRVDNSCNILK